MSEIERLLAEHCPEGVQFRRLCDLGTRNAGVNITAARMRSLATEGGPIRVFAGGQTIADVAEGAVDGRSVIRLPSIIVKSRGHIDFTYYDGPFTHKAEIWSYSITDSSVDQKFVYYYLKTRVESLRRLARANSVKLPQLAVRDTDGLKIPVPPLEVQREIVAILDRMERLEAELEAELEARRRQYAYYRDALLTFDEAGGVRWVPMGELGKWVGGITPSKSEPRYWERGIIPWVASMDISATGGREIRGRVTQAAVDETSLRLVSAPSVAVVMRSNILRRFLPVGFLEVQATANQDMRLLIPADGIEARYVFQAIKSTSEAIRANCVRTDGSMAAVDSKSFFEWRVPVPEPEEQRRIAAVLDSFDALVNDLSSGLPAEIAARRKQYEYYRDRLLTFEELAA